MFDNSSNLDIDFLNPQRNAGLASSLMQRDGGGYAPDLSVFNKTGGFLPESKGLWGIKGLDGMGALKLGASGAQTLAGLWASIQALKVAKQQMAMTRATTNANLANQTQSYNTSISDRARARGVMEGQSEAQVADYITQNSLKNRTV